MKTKQWLMMAALTVLACSCQKEETEYDASGVFETTDVIVSAKGAGEIMSLNIEEGQEVDAGMLLGSIDSKQLALKRQQAEASKSQMQASVEQADASKQQTAATKAATESKKVDVGPQIAALEQQVANLKREKSRFEALYRDNAASEKQVSDIDYQIKTTQKQIEAVRAQYNTSNGAIDKQGATYDAQQLAIDAQKRQIGAQSAQIDAQIGQINDQISNYNIVSPIKGTILSKYAEAGEYAAPGRALFKVANVTDMKLRAYITADQLTKIKIGQKVKVYADQGTDGRKEYQGAIVWISTKAEFTPKTIQTRDERANLVYAIKIAVKNDGLIKRGMYGDVKF